MLSSICYQPIIHIVIYISILSVIVTHSSVSGIDGGRGNAHSSSKIRTLVLIDNYMIKETHSIFFDELRARNHELSIYHIYDSSIPPLSLYDTYHYDNLLLLAPTGELFDINDHINVESITSFVDTGHNVIAIYNQQVTEPYRQLALEYDIRIDDENTTVTDSQYHVVGGSILQNRQDGREIIAFPSSAANTNVTASITSPILYSGIGHTHLAVNERILPILRGTKTTEVKPLVASSSDTDAGKKPSLSKRYSHGLNTLLVTGIQTPSNSRLLFCGSTEMWSNEYFKAGNLKLSNGNVVGKSDNQLFATHIAEWTYGQRNVLRVSNLQHRRVSNDSKKDVIEYKRESNVVTNNTSYRVGDWVEFAVDVQQYNAVEQRWTGYIANDIQVQLIMLDPYYRVYLPHQHDGRYNITLRLPDNFGIYKWVIDYHRQGYSHVFVNETISVRPYRHDEYERFLFVAYPYYITAFSLIAAFMLFFITFMYSPASQSTGIATTEKIKHG